jgi:phosphatidylglycerol:prolipoprotein diacylglycerol transferase
VIPYFTAPSLPIVGPLAIHPFGVLVALSVLLGTTFIGWRAERVGYDADHVQDFITRSMFTAFVSGHVFDQLFYHPEELLTRPWAIFMLWEGLSSAGGFLGTFLGALHWSLYEQVPSSGFFPRFRRREQRFGLVPVTEITLHTFPFAWFVGRMGCAVAHDHLGAAAPPGHWLAVAAPVHPVLEPPFWSWHGFALYAGSQPRFDLGLLEALWALVIGLAFAATWSRRLPVGSYAAAGLMAYGYVRFFLDFYRLESGSTGDRRWGELTFAQYLSIALFMTGFGIAVRLARGERFDDSLLRARRSKVAEAPTHE